MILLCLIDIPFLYGLFLFKPREVLRNTRHHLRSVSTRCFGMFRTPGFLTRILMFHASTNMSRNIAQGGGVPATGAAVTHAAKVVPLLLAACGTASPFSCYKHVCMFGFVSGPQSGMAGKPAYQLACGVHSLVRLHVQSRPELCASHWSTLTALV